MPQRSLSAANDAAAGGFQDRTPVTFKYLDSLKPPIPRNLASEAKDDLRLKVLVKLERYYPVVPSFFKEEPAFVRYHKMLREYEQSDPSAIIRGYVAARLKEIEVGQVEVMAHDSQNRAEAVIEKVTCVAA